MFGIVFISIIFSIISIIGIISIFGMYLIYRLTGGKKGFMWYIRHI